MRAIKIAATVLAALALSAPNTQGQETNVCKITPQAQTSATVWALAEIDRLASTRPEICDITWTLKDAPRDSYVGMSHIYTREIFIDVTTTHPEVVIASAVRHELGHFLASSIPGLPVQTAQTLSHAHTYTLVSESAADVIGLALAGSEPHFLFYIESPQESTLEIVREALL